MTTEWVRCFVAVELPTPIVAALEDVERALRREGGEGVKWVSAAQIHITLKFLGNVDQLRIPTIEGALRAAAPELRPFELAVGGLGAFPNPRRPRVIWVGVQSGGAELQQLQTAVDGALAALGFAPEQRPFSPHLTLGRVRETASPEQLQKLARLLASATVGALGSTRVTSITFMRSKLTPTGPIYSRLSVLPLAHA